MISDAAFRRSAERAVLYAETLENLQRTVVHTYGKRDFQFTFGILESEIIFLAYAHDAGCLVHNGNEIIKRIIFCHNFSSKRKRFLV